MFYPYTMRTHTKKHQTNKQKQNSSMYGGPWDSGGFMKNFRFDTICNIAQELQRFSCACGFIGKSDVILSIAVKSHKY